MKNFTFFIVFVKVANMVFPKKPVVDDDFPEPVSKKKQKSYNSRRKQFGKYC